MDIENEEGRSLLEEHNSAGNHRQGELTASKWRNGVSVSPTYLLIFSF